MSRSRKPSGGPTPRPEPERYAILLTRAAERGLASLSKPALRRVDAKIQGLAVDPRPHGAKKLQGVDDLYRVRVGDFRILYQLEDALLVVVVVDVGNRRDVYRSL